MQGYVDFDTLQRRQLQSSSEGTLSSVGMVAQLDIHMGKKLPRFYLTIHRSIPDLLKT